MTAKRGGEDGIGVTVLIVTHDHARYAGAAFESALAQRMERPFEIIISDDCSTDGTKELAESYALKHPAMIRVLHSERNLKSNEVVLRGIHAARGRYISILDGDDYWIDQRKLEKQAAYLDENEGCGAVFGNAVVARGDELLDELWTPPKQEQFLSWEGIWLGNPFATCTGMMRASLLRNVGPWYNELFPITDWPLYIVCAQGGALAFVNEVVGVYRLHDRGLLSCLHEKERHAAIAAFYRQMAACLDGRHRRAAREGCARYFFDWAHEYKRKADSALARWCLLKSIASGGVGSSVSFWEVAKLGGRLLLPGGNR